jgi:hypothetical protein
MPHADPQLRLGARHRFPWSVPALQDILAARLLDPAVGVTMQTSRDDLLREANRLYWDSDMSIGRIAERLGWSRRALYEAVLPEPSGVACAECAAPTVYANRSARENRQAVCSGCGRMEQVEPASPAAAAGALEAPSPRVSSGGEEEVNPAAPATVSGSGTPRPGSRWRVPVALGIVFGVAVGTLTMLSRRR